LFCIGLAKKVILANTIGRQADAIFNLAPEHLDTFTAWAGALSYTFQIYFDFSGYSDMAIGLCKTMGFHIPENFNNPYASQSVTEFWRRWHITLGRWMKNYLYIPLGGNRSGSVRTLMNLWIVFLLSGLWHGAGWNFVVWGGYHGMFLALERWKLLKWYEFIPSVARVALTFLIVVTGWVFFRNENIHYALAVLKNMFSFHAGEGRSYLNNDFWFSLSLCTIFSFWILVKPLKEFQQRVYLFDSNEKFRVRLALAAVGLYYVTLSYIAALGFNPFIYFRF
jgi:alginate O-acetyltransferase complex protein AlgI